MSKLTHHFDHEITIEKVACPIHVINMKKGIDNIKAGETLRVISNAYVAEELMAAARQLARNVILDKGSELFIKK